MKKGIWIVIEQSTNKILAALCYYQGAFAAYGFLGNISDDLLNTHLAYIREYPHAIEKDTHSSRQA